MLFGQTHKDILMSMLNNLLDFTGDNEIKELEISSEKLDNHIFSYEHGKSTMSCEVDVLCTTQCHKKIAIEMQRAKQQHILARAQHYMSRLISVQMNIGGGGNAYHEEMFDTYVLVLEKQNLFTGTHKLRDESLYEIDVMPIIEQTKEVFPENKMHWKFFELSRFENHDCYRSLTKESCLKHQWLEFLINCGNQLHEPDRNDMIKKGYEIMKMAQWDCTRQSFYWLEQSKQAGRIEEQRYLTNRGIIIGKLQSDIAMIKIGIEENWDEIKIQSKLSLLNKNIWLEREWSEEQRLTLVESINICPSKFAQLHFYIQQREFDTSVKIFTDLAFTNELEKWRADELDIWCNDG